MIIWRGWGIVVAAVAAAGLLAGEFVGSALMGAAYDDNRAWVNAIGLLVASACLWPIGRRLNGGSQRVLVDQATGEQVVLRPDHALFFVRVEYWAPILAIVSLAMIVTALV